MSSIVNFETVKGEVDKIAKDHGIMNYHLNVKERKFTGDNYTSKIVSVQVKENEGENKEMNFLIKLTSMTAEIREKFPTQNVFTVEKLAYTLILPTLYNYQLEYDVPEEKRFIYPKFYAGSTEPLKEFMIFQDASFEGYGMYGKTKTLDYEHSKVIYLQLARYHAASFAIREKNPLKFEQLIANIEREHMFGELVEKMTVRILDEVVPQLKSPEKGKILMDFSRGCGKLIEERLNSKYTAPYNMICHGDFHINNMMFRYVDNKPEVLFVDWQILKYGSPCIDFLEIIFMSTTRKFRDQNLKQLCDDYYNTLRESLNYYGCKVEKIYPRKVFDKQLNELMPHGILLGIAGSIIFLLKPGEEINLEEMLSDTSELSIVASDEMIERLEEYADDILMYRKLMENK